MKFSSLVLAIVILALLSSPFAVIRPLNGTFGEGTYQNGVSDMVISGDHIIANDESVLWDNMTVHLLGSLTVNGDLVIRNSTIFLSDDILINGNLTISDNDGDPLTSSDSSRVYRNNSGGAIKVQFGGHLIFRNSWAREINFSGEQKEVNGSILINCRILTGPGDVIRDLIFENHTGNMTEAAIGAYSDFKTYFEDITVTGYDRGIFVTTGGVEISDSRFVDCSVGVYSLAEDPMIFKSVSIINSTTPFVNNGPVDIRNSFVRNGSIFLSDNPFIASSTRFENLGSISGLNSGIVNECDFIDCDYGFDSPKGLTLTRSIFQGCRVALNQPTGSLIYHNSFKGNLNIAIGIPSSDWYQSDIMEGNFYSSYRGRDDGSGSRTPDDGIGDTDLPYLGRDMFPLMKDRLWEMPRIGELKLENEKGSGVVNISWSANDITGSIVQRSTTMDFSLNLVTWSVAGTSFSVLDNPNATLYFRVAVYNEVGFRGWSSPRSVDIDQRPLQPVGMVVEAPPEGRSLRVRWVHNGEDINKTYLFYSPWGGQVSPPIPIEHPVNDVLLEGLVNGVLYNISAIAEDHAGQLSELSDNHTGTPRDLIAPPPPRNLRGDAVSNTSIRIFWDPPLIQDISIYQLFRKDPESGSFEWIANISRLSYEYLDQGLRDNTSYVYTMRSVDDDGPISVFSVDFSISTLHFNNEPIFSGDHQYVYMMEDQGPYSIPVEELVYDPDGDVLQVIIEEFYRIRAELVENTIWIMPAEDQAGSGFVKVVASDGETSSFVIVGILIEEVPDPPEDVMIISPTEGEVLLPDRSILFSASAFDPDIPYGDNLTYRWYSNKDGPLNPQGSLREHLYSVLSPGEHEITLSVVDMNGTYVNRTVHVLVSLWGREEQPWKASIVDIEAYTDRGKVTVRFQNDAPIQLSFVIKPNDLATESVIAERGVLVPPSSYVELIVQMIPPMSEGATLELEFMVISQTVNGTYAGEMILNASVIVKGQDKDDSSELLVIVLIIISLLIAIIGVIGVIVLTRGSSVPSNEEDGENVQEGAVVPEGRKGGPNG